MPGKASQNANQSKVAQRIPAFDARRAQFPHRDTEDSAPDPHRWAADA